MLARTIAVLTLASAASLLTIGRATTEQISGAATRGRDNHTATTATLTSTAFGGAVQLLDVATAVGPEPSRFASAHWVQTVSATLFETLREERVEVSPQGVTIRDAAGSWPSRVQYPLFEELARLGVIDALSTEGTLLDVAAGGGVWGLTFGQRAAHVVLTDVNPASRGLAEQNAKANLRPSSFTILDASGVDHPHLRDIGAGDGFARILANPPQSILSGNGSSATDHNFAGGVALTILRDAPDLLSRTDPDAAMYMTAQSRLGLHSLQGVIDDLYGRGFWVDVVIHDHIPAALTYHAESLVRELRTLKRTSEPPGFSYVDAWALHDDAYDRHFVQARAEVRRLQKELGWQGPARMKQDFEGGWTFQYFLLKITRR